MGLYITGHSFSPSKDPGWRPRDGLTGAMASLDALGGGGRIGEQAIWRGVLEFRRD